MADHRLVILIPVHDDWIAAQMLLADLDRALAAFDSPVSVLFVNDGSREPPPAAFATGGYQKLQSVEILHLRRNLGHQRAIAVGLVYVYEHMPCRAVVVMDGDGEDRPADIVSLAARFEKDSGRSVIFAARAKRLEGSFFRALYQVYRGVHWVLTGDSVRVGNFSMVPFDTLGRLVVVPEIWNHYAAAVVRSRLRFDSIPISRGQRLAGKSKMNFIGLLLHGLSAFFVYGDIIGARLLVGITIALLLQFIAVAIGLGVRYSIRPDLTGLMIYISALLGIILLQAIPIALILVFVVIGRTNTGFLPIRDCPYFVSSVERVFPKNA